MYIGILYSLALFLCITCCDGSANVRVSESLIVDESGRARIYHGVNFVMKQFPWYPQELLDSIYVESLSKCGLNFVRLGMMWSGVEPEPQKYNATYLDVIKNIIELLQLNHIFVLLDMHQDILSSQTGGYDGVPLWLYNRFPSSSHSYPWPFKIDPIGNNWFMSYMTEACSHGFQCLYENIGGAADSMSKFWRLVASTYKQYSNVLGYEIINEPWVGNYFKNPKLLLPGVAGATNLQPFYDTMAKAIRSVDNDTLIFFEPVTWGVRLNGKYFGTGFSHVPGGDDYRDRSVLSYHYYCIILSLIPIPGNSTVPISDRVVCDKIEGPALFRSIQSDVLQLGGGSFLTEFGGCEGSPACDEQLDWGLSAADLFLQSWAFWGNSYADPITIKRLSRVYARAIAGKPLAMQFLAQQRSFYLSYYINTTIPEPTEIVVPPVQYPEFSYRIFVNNALKWRIDSKESNVILVEPNDQTQGLIGVIEIHPK
ncbi:unnamed protein product [Adineta ricciae]|uniref:Uncharacterized protein n=1 Tax=Adineta ricciae TaxID=249248 RepID=A0A813Y7V4_ADIRI|nr:unnamed protein product [Adineta ricciae]